MKRNIRTLAISALWTACGLGSSMFAQPLAIEPAQAKSFTLATLNVDGLPGTIFFVPTNPDGPQAAGSVIISKYLADKKCDILCLQEDFNYRWEIWSHLFACYEHDEWSGGILLGDESVDLAHPQNVKFGCDGLNTLWKKDIQAKNYQRIAWQHCFGKFSHALDDMVTKGFRRHELSIPGVGEVVVYNMHMDASARRDRLRNSDTRDKETRISQWVQLREHILAHLDHRPVIVAGDLNSFYHRDDIKGVFIDGIEVTGKATVRDAWIETANKGRYPHVGDEPIEGETFDKVLFINPTDGNTLSVCNAKIDKKGYTVCGEPLGDHYPLFVTFNMHERKTSDIQSAGVTGTGAHEVFDISGVRRTPGNLTHGVYVIDGKKVAK